MVKDRRNDRSKDRLQMKNCILGRILLSLLVILAILTSIAPPMKCEQRESVVGSSAKRSQHDAQKKIPDYRIWRIMPPEKKQGFALAFVSVSPEHFNREAMATLAGHLNKEFKRRDKIKAILFDDHVQAKNYAIGANDPDAMEDYVRGIYLLDRSKPEEYIQFSSEKNKPRDEITIRL
jgi:hypothetical protein